MGPTSLHWVYLTRRFARFATDNESWHSVLDPELAYSLALVEPLGEDERRASAGCEWNRFPLQRRGAMDSTLSTGIASTEFASAELVPNGCAWKRFRLSQMSNLNKCLNLRIQRCRRRTMNKNRSSTVDSDDSSTGFAVAEVQLGSFCTCRL